MDNLCLKVEYIVTKGEIARSEINYDHLGKNMTPFSSDGIIIILYIFSFM